MESKNHQGRVVAILRSHGRPWTRLKVDQLDELVRSVIRSGNTARVLRDYLEDAGGTFAKAADPSMPTGAQRLLRAARAAGLNVRLPRCVDCNRERMIVTSRPDGVRVCASCAGRAKRTKGALDPVTILAEQGEPWASHRSAELQAIIETAAPSASYRGRLAQYLSAHPCVASERDPHAPIYVQRLLHIAHSQGYRVERAICPGCKQPRILQREGYDGTRICLLCATNNTYGKPSALDALVILLRGQGAPWTTLDVRLLQRIVRSVAETERGIAMLTGQIKNTRQPVATAADPQMRPQVQRFLRAARGQGVEVALPRCRRCGVEDFLPARSDGARICRRCKQRAKNESKKSSEIALAEQLRSYGEPWQQVSTSSLAAIVAKEISSPSLRGSVRNTLRTRDNPRTQPASDEWPHSLHAVLRALRHQGLGIDLPRCGTCGEENPLRQRKRVGKWNCFQCAKTPRQIKVSAIEHLVDTLIRQGRPWNQMGESTVRDIVRKVASNNNRAARLHRTITALPAPVTESNNEVTPKVFHLLEQARALGWDIPGNPCPRCGKNAPLVHTNLAGNRVCGHCRWQEERSLRPRAPQRLKEALRAQGAPWKHLDESILVQLIDTHMPSHRAAGRVLKYVSAAPPVATSRDPRMQHQMQNLLHDAHARGIDVLLPQCERCHEESVLHFRKAQGCALCDACARHYVRKRPCVDCGRLRRAARLIDGRAYCSSCWVRHPEGQKICLNCGKLRVAVKRVAGGVLCYACAPASEERCVHCGHTRPVSTRTLGGATCHSCRVIISGRRRECPQCGEKTLVASITDEGTLACSTCAGRPSRYTCARCGREDIKYGRLCFQCAYTDRIEAMFAAGNQARRAQLEPLKQRLLTQQADAQRVFWVQRRLSARLIRDLLASDVPITHEIIDASTSRQAGAIVRNLLVEVGVLPPRDDAAARFDTWLQGFVHQLPEHHRSQITPFFRFELAKSARALAQTRQQSGDIYARARYQARCVRRFVEHVHRSGYTLSTAHQGTLDEYFLTRHTERYAIAPFIRWMRETKINTRLSASQLDQYGTAKIYSFTDYQHWINRFVTVETIPLRIRIIALLIAMIGRPTSRIINLRRADVTDNEKMTITFGTTPVEVPVPLADLIRQHLTTPNVWNPDTEWLFPSPQLAGRHIDPKTVNAQIRRLGCDVLALRGAGLLNLAATVPAGALPDLTGLALATAESWRQRAAASYASYPELRPPNDSRAG